MVAFIDGVRMENRDAGRSITDQVEELVRSQIRVLGIDPMRDRQDIREVIDTCVAEVFSRALLGDNPLPLSSDSVAQQVHHAVAGFGPLQRFFDDPTVEELWINDPGKVFIAREGRSELTSVVLTDADVRDLVERMLRASGRRLDLSNPFVDAMLVDGSRLHVAIPDITRSHWAINVRRFVVHARHVHDLIPTGTLSTQAADFLEAAVVSGLNIVVAGGTQAGKTTFLNALLGCVPSSERIVSCEEVFEIKIVHPDWVPMQTRDASLEGTGEVPLRRLVREALRMRPTRLVVGEVRQGEALDLLVAMNSGMPAMATLHANSAREAVTKLCTLPLLAGQNISGDFVIPTVAGCVDIVVHLATDHEGIRRVREIVALPGRVESGTVEIADLFINSGAGLVRAQGFPPHPERFSRRGFDLTVLLDSPADTNPARGWAA